MSAEQIISNALRNDWDVDTPHPMQIEAIQYIAFDDNSLLFLITKMGSNKSDVPLTVASLSQGVAIILVPLVGLGSDQVSKALRPDRKIEANHVDEFKRADGKKLRRRMKNGSDDETLVSTQILYMSPRALSKDLLDTV